MVPHGTKRVFTVPLAQRRPDVRADIREEFQFHLDMRTAELVAEGRSESDARAQARREFGDAAAGASACARVDPRVEWRQRVSTAHGRPGARHRAGPAAAHPQPVVLGAVDCHAGAGHRRQRGHLLDVRADAVPAAAGGRARRPREPVGAGAKAGRRQLQPGGPLQRRLQPADVSRPGGAVAGLLGALPPIAPPTSRSPRRAPTAASGRWACWCRATTSTCCRCARRWAG